MTTASGKGNGSVPYLQFRKLFVCWTSRRGCIALAVSLVVTGIVFSSLGTVTLGTTNNVVAPFLYKVRPKSQPWKYTSSSQVLTASESLPAAKPVVKEAPIKGALHAKKIPAKSPNLLNRFSSKMSSSPSPVALSTTGGLETKIILLWNKLFTGKYDTFVNDGIKTQCPTYRCHATHDQSVLQRATAVVFHMWPQDRIAPPPPKLRSSKQRFVFLLNESPARLDYHLDEFDHFFNLTMTYRRDADVHFPYGNTYSKSPPSNTENTPQWRERMRRLATKRRLAVWMVSHCHTNSSREEYVWELRKYIPIDIYGRCGDKTCQPARSPQCYQMVARTYKFVLAFENSICVDYVTEKVFENLERDIVPVVFGGADYDAILPQHSYINTANFRSPAELAAYLKYLDANMEAYRQYFKWRHKFFTLSTSLEWQRAFCQLCKVLNNEDYPRKSYSVGDLKRHWGKQTCDSTYLRRMKVFW